MNCSVVILSSLTEGTGNRTTAQRLQKHLESANFKAHLCGVDNFQEPNSLKSFVVEHNVRVAIGIHLVRAGGLLVTLDIPFIIIAGGTDLNVLTEDVGAIRLMTEVLEKSKHLVVFTESARRIASEAWPSLDLNITVQPQCVQTSPTEFTFDELFQEYYSHRIEVIPEKTFLLVGGIRPVKDPLFVAQTVSTMHATDPSIRLVIIGPELDAEFAMRCRITVAGLAGVHLFPTQPPSRVHSLMQQCCALVNSSRSEGMCGALLEAMSLGTPVLARHNEGNLSIVTDKENGLIFQSCVEFEEKAWLLLKDGSLRRRLVENGKRYIEENHSMEKERDVYVDLVKQALNSPHLSVE